MNSKRRSAGYTLMDLVTTISVVLLTGGALIALLQATYSSGDSQMGQNLADTSARLPMDTLADSLRNAQVGSGNKVLSAAGGSDITLYNDTAGSTARLWLDTTSTPYTIRETTTQSGVTSAAQTILQNVSSLLFTYYPAGSTSTTANPNAPTAAEIPNLGSINIAITVNINGYARTLTTQVRLRNSPYQTPSP